MPPVSSPPSTKKPYDGRTLAAKRKPVTETVASLGEAVPGKAHLNIEQLGYTCPRQHFIEGPGDLTPRAMAKLWGITLSTFERWVETLNWEELRRAHLAKLPAQHGGTLTPDEKLENLRVEHMEREIADIDHVLTLTKARLKVKTEDTVTGVGVESKRKSAASHKAEVESFNTLYQQRRVALGMPTKLTGTLNRHAHSFKQIERDVTHPPGTKRPDVQMSVAHAALPVGADDWDDEETEINDANDDANDDASDENGSDAPDF